MQAHSQWLHLIENTVFQYDKTPGNTVLFENYDLCTRSPYKQWTFPSLLFQTRRNNPSVNKGLKKHLSENNYLF